MREEGACHVCGFVCLCLYLCLYIDQQMLVLLSYVMLNFVHFSGNIFG